MKSGKGTRNRIYVSMSERAIAGYKCLASNVSDPTIANIFRGMEY